MPTCLPLITVCFFYETRSERSEVICPRMLNESVSDKSGRYMQSHLKTWLGKTCLLENFLFTGTYENAQNKSRNNLYAPFGQRRLKPLPSVRFPEIHVRIFPQIQQIHSFGTLFCQCVTLFEVQRWFLYLEIFKYFDTIVMMLEP